MQHFYNIEHCFAKIQPLHWYDFVKFWCCKSVVILVNLHHILVNVVYNIYGYTQRRLCTRHDDDSYGHVRYI